RRSHGLRTLGTQAATGAWRSLHLASLASAALDCSPRTRVRPRLSFRRRTAAASDAAAPSAGPFSDRATPRFPLSEAALPHILLPQDLPGIRSLVAYRTDT